MNKLIVFYFCFSPVKHEGDCVFIYHENRVDVGIMSKISVCCIITTQSVILSSYSRNIFFEYIIPDYLRTIKRKTGTISGFHQGIRHQDTNKTLLSLNILLRFIFYYHRLICRKTWEYAARYGFIHAPSFYSSRASMKPLAAVPLFFYRPQITRINTDSMFPFPLKSIADTLQAMRRLPKENNFLNFNLNLNLNLYNSMVNWCLTYF